MVANIALNGNAGFATLESSHYDGDTYGPAQAFDGNDGGNRWNSNLDSPVGAWLGCDFGSTKEISKVRIVQFGSGYSYATQYKVQSADDATFTTNLVDRYTSSGGLASGDNGLQTFTAAQARYWRVIGVTTQGSQNGWGIFTLEFHGVDGSPSLGLPQIINSSTLRAPVVFRLGTLDFPSLVNTSTLRAPIITNATPGGNVALQSLGATASASSTYAAGYEPYRAIDGDDTGSHDWNSSIASPVGQWLSVDLQSAKSISSFRLYQYSSGAQYAVGITIESSPDNSTWTERFAQTSGVAADTGTVALTTPATARYWRVTCTAASGGAVNGWGIYTFSLFSAGSAPSLPVTLPNLINTSVLFAPTVIRGAEFTLVLPRIVNASTLRAFTATPGTATVTLPLLVNASVLRAMTVQTYIGFLLPRIVNASVLRAFSLNLDSQEVLLPHFVNVSILRPFLAHIIIETGLRSPLWGSGVPFWLEEVIGDEVDDRLTYRMPFRIARGGPGRRIVLPGLGTRLPFWIEEHPDHPGSFIFPVMDGINPRRAFIPAFGRTFTVWVEEHPTQPGAFVFPAHPVVTPTSDPEDGLQARMFGTNTTFLLLDESPTTTPPGGRKAYAMPLRMARDGVGLRVDLRSTGRHIPFWIEEDPDVSGAYVLPVRD